MWQFVFDRKTIANVEMCYNLFLALLDLKFISGHLLIPVFSFHFQVEISNILYDFHSKLPKFSQFEVEIYDFSGDFHSKLTYKDYFSTFSMAMSNRRSSVKPKQRAWAGMMLASDIPGTMLASMKKTPSSLTM